jgi:hypothetical protein
MPQPPQLFGSLVVSTQPEPHETPVVHTHMPPVHVRPVPHAVPHAPQFMESIVGSTQPPLHIMRGEVQLATQVVPEQSGVAPPHAFAHEPQCIGLFITFTHAEPQSISPTAQPLVSGPTSTGDDVSFGGEVSLGGAVSLCGVASFGRPVSLAGASTFVSLRTTPPSGPPSVVFAGPLSELHPTSGGAPRIATTITAIRSEACRPMRPPW